MYRLFTDSGHKNQLIHVSNEKNPGVFFEYMEGYTTQLCRYYHKPL